MMGSEAATIILGPLKSKMGESNETEEVSEEEEEAVAEEVIALLRCQCRHGVTRQVPAPE